MKRIRFLVQLLAALCLIGASLIAVPEAYATIAVTITVNTTELTHNDNENCDLLEALTAASTNTVTDSCGAGGNSVPDIIAFDIGGGGAQTITPTGIITVNSPVHINGASQPVYAGTPLIKITSTAAPVLQLTDTAQGSTLEALQLVTSGSGATVEVLGDQVTLRGNYINTDGTSALGAGTPNLVLSTSSYSVIGGATAADRNLFGAQSGISIDGGQYNTVQGNYFGVTSAGSTLLAGMPASPVYGMELGGSAATSNTTVRGNVISGGYDYGIRIGPYATSNTIAGNIIGLGADGVTRISNVWGVYIQGAATNTIGGTTADDRNVISGNSKNVVVGNYSGGIIMEALNNQIAGNYIGTTADGMSRVTAWGVDGTDEFGIYLEAGDSTTIGGATAAHGNVIGGNDCGIKVLADATYTDILNNKIGTNKDGTAALRQEDGIWISGGTSSMIGDNVTPGNNVVSGNDTGIYLVNSAGVTIYGNRIGLTAFGNAPLGNGIGIQLGDTSSPTISRNWIAHSITGLYVPGTATVGAGSTNNCFTANTNYGAFAATGATPSLVSNWWGSRTGPTHWGNPAGTGDAVTDGVTYSSFLTKPPAACQHPTADFEGDGKSDLGYFHPSTGLWGILQSSHGHDYGYARYFTWGTTGDIVTPADYDGDGIVDPTVRRPPSGGQSAAYLILRSTTNYNYGLSLTIPAGWPGLGDTPVPGDYNGDGKSDPGIWRGSAGVWIIPLSPSFGSYAFYSWGTTGDKPIAADVDGDGQTDIGYWRPSTGVWGFLQSSAGYSYASPLFFSWGTSADIPVMADYDGDGYDDPAVVIPPAGGQSRAYRVLLSSMSYNPASSLTIPAGWPGLGDTPAPADYDGDGKADPAIWRGNTGVWIVPLSSGGYSTYLFRAWGASGDQIAR